MTLTDLLSNVETIDAERGYWFIRTDSGINFETFVQHNFIGIGWNEITQDDLYNKSPSEVKAKIAVVEKIDLKLAKSKSLATSIYTKLHRFATLKKGDFVLIPSYGSSRLAFGEIQDSKIYSDVQPKGGCDYVKRRKVKWTKVENINDLDPIFYQIKHPRHAIFDIKRYQNHLDRVAETLYSRNDYVHYILDIKTRKDIDINTLLELMDSIKKLTKSINTTFDLREEEQLSVKLSLQSPGSIEFIRKVGGTIVILATILSACSNGQAESTGNQKLDNFIEVNMDTINKVDKTMKELEMDRNKINNL